MLSKSITGRLTKHLLEDSHPTVDWERCVNRRQQKRPCCICASACPVGALDDPDKPDYTMCDDCGICAAHCPGGAIVGSSLYVQKLMELVERPADSVVLGCRAADGEADCKLGCLAAYPWEVLALLALGGSKLSFLTGTCESCPIHEKMPLFQRSLEQLRTFLGEERYLAAMGEGANTQPQTRREALTGLLRRGGRSAAAVLPESLRQAPDSDLWRQLLRLRLCAGSGEEGETPMEARWTTPLIRGSCRACGICAQVCPNGALHVLPTEDGHFYMAHFGWRCRGCGVCGAVCPWDGIDGFGVMTTSRPERPLTTLTAAHPCGKCGAPCGGEEELCLACAIQARGG